MQLNILILTGTFPLGYHNVQTEIGDTPPKTNMTMENQAFEDVFHFEHSHFPTSC